MSKSGISNLYYSIFAAALHTGQPQLFAMLVQHVEQVLHEKDGQLLLLQPATLFRA